VTDVAGKIAIGIAVWLILSALASLAWVAIGLRVEKHK
jgi:hypothetical protein